MIIHKFEIINETFFLKKLSVVGGESTSNTSSQSMMQYVLMMMTFLHDNIYLMATHPNTNLKYFFSSTSSLLHFGKMTKDNHSK